MRKLIVLLLLLSLAGCSQPVVQPPETSPPAVEEPQTIEPEIPETTVETPESETVEPETVEPETTEPETTEPETVEPEPGPTVADYFPVFKDTIRFFEGVNNEFASYRVRTEYIKDDLVQFHVNNGGTETVNVYRITEDEVRLIFTESENYSRLSRLDYTAEDQERILLQAPLEVGHSWEDPVIGTSTIIRLDEPIVILGSQLVKAIAVESNGVINYFAQDFGLVKSVYPENDISSTLDKLTEDTEYPERIDIVQIDSSAQPIGTMSTFDMRTNDSLMEKLSQALRRERPDGLALPDGFKIREIEKEPMSDEVYIDISSDIYHWEVAATDEAITIKELGLTLGGYFAVSQVYLSVDQQDYDSGTLSLDKNVPLN